MRRFEMLGLPLHLWTDANIKKVASNLGVVEQIHYRRNDWSTIDVCVVVELNNPKHQFHNVIVVNDSQRNFSVMVKEVKVQTDKDENLVFFTPEDSMERIEVEK